MHLIGFREESGWLTSRWELTYPASWENIQKGAAALYVFFDQTEVFVDGEKIEISGSEDISNLEEHGKLVIRGMSSIVKVPVMITFYNQLQAVDVVVAQANEEFENTDYEKFNHSMCQYLDSAEIAMYR
ncbi:MAG: hypothetical protein E7254_05900 [Lachnospiraceae bacterium]|nr:hypothetical protein [Lachnospiraceae bacterium]